MHLGGEDFDNILVKFWIEEFKKRKGIDLLKEEVNSREISRIKYHCEKAKKELTFNDAIVIEIESLFKWKDLILEITRVKFEKLCDKIFNSIIIPINEVMNIAKEKKEII